LIKPFYKLKNFFKERLGPGLITGISDDDPAGIFTYSLAGARGGFDFLWTSLFTLPLMYNIQEICAKIALITKRGLISLIKYLFGYKITFFLAILLFFANTFNLSANINAIGLILNYIFPFIPIWLYSLVISLFMFLVILMFPYKKIYSLLKFFALFIFSYIFLIFFIKINWIEALKNFLLPTIKFSEDYLIMLVAILGTTISPYMFFWQEEQEIEEISHKKNLNIKREINIIRIDTFLGMLISNVIMFFIILTTGQVLFYDKKIYNIESLDQLLMVFYPLFGKYSFLFFSLGFIAVGLISIPVLSGAVAYSFAELFNIKPTFDKKLFDAFPFYGFIFLSLTFANILNIFGLSTFKMLFYSSIIYGFLAPILVYIILKIGESDVMKNFKISKFNKTVGYFTFFIMMFSLLVLLISIIF
jgi:Mn2+/Fe2+ NRAMP family transporter